MKIMSKILTSVGIRIRNTDSNSKTITLPKETCTLVSKKKNMIMFKIQTNMLINSGGDISFGRKRQLN